MTTRTILLTLAASVAPLYAQQPTIPASQAFTTLATPAAQADAATPEQRAQVFSALALLPQNISDFAVLTNIGANLLHLAESRVCPELEVGDLPSEVLALDNIALASTPATPATYALLRHTLVNLSTLGSTMQLAQDWAGQARAELRDSIIEELVLRADAASAPEGDAAAGAHIPPTYIIITSRPGEETVLQECYSLLLGGLQEENRPGITPVQDECGFSGIRMDMVETYKAELKEMTQNMAPRRKEMVLEELAKHPVYLLVRQQGNALIIALCENPQELQLAASPADSLLATDKLAACDTNLSKGMIAAGHVSTELAAIGNEVNTQPTFNLADGIRAVFTRLAEVESANKAAYEQAASAVSFLASELQKLTRPITQPSFMQMWCDGDLHFCLTSDAQGCSYRPGTLRLAALANAPNTSFYAETTPMQLGITPSDSNALLEAAFSVADGFSLTLAEENRAQAVGALAALKAFAPELQSLASAAATIGSGLDGQLAFVLDSVPGQLPRLSAETPSYTDAQVPRFSVFAGVCDRSKLSAGWDALLATAGQAAGKFGLSPEVVNLLPIVPRQEGSATSYSLALPLFTQQDALPSLAVSNTGLAAGTSARLNVQVLESATGTTPFSGAVFALRFAPLAKTLRSLATALDPAPEEAEPVASSQVKLEGGNEASVHLATVGGADGPTSVFVAGERSKVQEASDQLSTAAAIFEYASTVAEGVFGASTIENGLHTLKVDVKMKK